MDTFPASSDDRAALIARFKPLDAAHVALRERLVDAMSDELLLGAANKLGLERKGRLDVKDDFEAEALTEYALHAEFSDGGTFISKRLASGFAEAGSQDEVVLRALAEARFSIFEVVETIPGLGVELRDLLRHSRTKVVLPDHDEGMAPGVHFMGRVIDVEGITMMAGSIFPVPKELAVALAEAVYKESDTKPIEKDAREPGWIGSAMMEALLETKRLSSVKMPARSTKIGRNEPCPCGSGKKYKKCCGA